MRRLNWGTTRWLAWRKDVYSAWVLTLTGSETKMKYKYPIRLNARGLPPVCGLDHILRMGSFENSRRLFLSLLKDYDGVKDEINYNIESITNPSTYKGYSLGMDKLLQPMRIKKFSPPKENDWFIASTGGPNGSPAYLK